MKKISFSMSIIFITLFFSCSVQKTEFKIVDDVLINLKSPFTSVSYEKIELDDASFKINEKNLCRI